MDNSRFSPVEHSVDIPDTSPIGQVTRFVDESVEDIDLFGNTPLHQCFGNNEITISTVLKMLADHPEHAKVKNQFDRIPLHYALDRSRVNVDGIRILLQCYPEGVSVRDADGHTPYDLSVRWKHHNSIKKMILDIDPSLDHAASMKIKYGPISNLLVWMYSQPTTSSDPDEGQYSSADNSVTDNITDNVPEFSTLPDITHSPSPPNPNNSNNPNTAMGTRRKSWNAQLADSFASSIQSVAATVTSSGRRRSFGGAQRIHSIDGMAEEELQLRQEAVLQETL